MRTIYTAEQIAARVEETAHEVVTALGPDFTMVPILTGGFMLAADMARALYRVGGDPEIDFIQLASYGQGRISSGEVRLVKDVNAPVEGLTVLLVDDVLDTGRSVIYARQLFEQRGAARVATLVAVDKVVPGRAVEADFKLFTMQDNAFLVGYGMDDAGGRRGLPEIGAVGD